MTSPADPNRYEEVMKANIAVHTKMADQYSTCEPHFRPENVRKVEARLRAIRDETRGTRQLDLGCGTGFMIRIGKGLFTEIHGVDITPAMMAKVDRSGPAKIELFECDAGKFEPRGSYDAVTAYSFLHHLFDVRPVYATAFCALRPGGVFYADLEPNFYFWEAIGRLDRGGAYDPLVRREIEMVTYKDEDVERNFGVPKQVFHDAEWGKNATGGFREETVVANLKEIGFRDVKVFYHWFLGQASLLNEPQYQGEDRFHVAGVTDGILQRALPVSRSIYKYIGIEARK